MYELSEKYRSFSSRADQPSAMASENSSFLVSCLWGVRSHSSKDLDPERWVGTRLIECFPAPVRLFFHGEVDGFGCTKAESTDQRGTARRNRHGTAVFVPGDLYCCVCCEPLVSLCIFVRLASLRGCDRCGVGGPRCCTYSRTGCMFPHTRSDLGSKESDTVCSARLQAI